MDIMTIAGKEIDLETSIAFNLNKTSKENFGFENQLIDKHLVVAKVEAEETIAYVVTTIDKKSKKTVCYTWSMAKEQCNQKSVGHYLKVRDAEIVTEENNDYDFFVSLIN